MNIRRCDNTRLLACECSCCISRRGILLSASASVAAGLVSSASTNAQLAPETRAPHRIDVHHHILPPPYIEAARERILAVAPTFLHVLKWTPQQSIDAMDRAGIATAITSISTPGIWFGDAQTSRKLARQCNEYAAGMVQNHAGRFGVFAALPLPDIEGSLREVEYALDVLKADGIGLMTSYGDKWPGDRAFAPIFEELNRRRAVVFFHPTTPSCCSTLIPDVPSSAIEFLFDTARAIASLLYSGSLSRFSNIKFVFSHSGGALPPIADRMARLANADQRVAARLPNGAMYELKRLYYDVATSVGRTNLGALLQLVSLTNILFGTDFPYLPISATLEGLLKFGLSLQELAAIERANAIALFPRLDTSSVPR
jgi:predicted TIM-barrel fold metal-dependent hydrolase